MGSKMAELEEKPTEIVSLKEARQMSVETAKKIRKADYEPDIIIGLSRGGWIPARLICDYLLVSDLVSLSVTHWGLPAEKSQEEAQLEHPFTVDVTDKKVLIIDDITDTGESLELTLDVVKRNDPAEVKTATMQYITSSSIEPDFYAEKVEDWRWFLYKWCWVEDLTGFVEGIIESQKEREWEIQSINEMLNKYNHIKVPKEELQNILKILVDQDKVKKQNRKKWKWKGE